MNGGKHILVVDREPEWRNFVTEVLNRAGFVVSPHPDVASTLLEISRRVSDLVLADASLDELIDKLAVDFADIRFLVFSASPSVAEAIKSFRRGALDYESKSFDPGLILNAVNTALGKPANRPFVLVDTVH